MVTKKPKGLGRGLEALLGPTAKQSAEDFLTSSTQTPSTLALGQMVAGKYQPRTRMEEGALYELAESIKAQGIMQPILVRLLKDGVNQGKYEIIAGERRFRAAKLAGLESVPVLVRDVPNEAAAAMALIENIQREDLNPLEEAQGLQRLVQEFGLSHDQAAQAVGRSRSAASNLLRLLHLTKPAQDLLMAGDIDMGHARALLALEHAQQISAAHEMVAKKMSVRLAEELVKRLKTGAQDREKQTKGRGQEKSRDVLRIEEELSDLLSATVTLNIKKSTPGNKSTNMQEHTGQVMIEFSSLDELNGLIDRLKKFA